MTGTILFAGFAVMLLAGVPIAVALGLAGTLAIWLAGQPILAVPTNVYAGIAKYPLIAIPMFVLVGSVFDRTGVALRLVRFATPLAGPGAGPWPRVGCRLPRVTGASPASAPATRPRGGQWGPGSRVGAGYPRPFTAATAARPRPTAI